MNGKGLVTFIFCVRGEKQVLGNVFGLHSGTFGILVFCGVILAIQCVRYKVIWWKAVIIVFAFPFFANVAVRLTSFLETGSWGGERLYGIGIFITPVVLLLSAVIRMSWGRVGDIVALSYLPAFVAGKVRCMIVGCCYGRMLFADSNILPTFQFPSQKFEIISLALLVAFLICVEIKKGAPGAMWPIFMVTYGISRYIADWLRGDPTEWEPFFLYIPAGRFFALLNIIIGYILLYTLLRKTLQRRIQPKEWLLSGFAVLPKDYLSMMRADIRSEDKKEAGA